jgi:hypothetical protein
MRILAIGFVVFILATPRLKKKSYEYELNSSSRKKVSGVVSWNQPSSDSRGFPGHRDTQRG